MKIFLLKSRRSDKQKEEEEEEHEKAPFAVLYIIKSPTNIDLSSIGVHTIEQNGSYLSTDPSIFEQIDVQISPKPRSSHIEKFSLIE